LPRRAVKAFRSAGATEEMIEVARLMYGSLANEPPGRPRKYKTGKEARHAYYMRHRGRLLKLQAIRNKKQKADAPIRAMLSRSRRLLNEAANGNVDPAADLALIQALVDQGCDLEADILPTVARTVPELPRPLKNWGAQWLTQEILAARDKRLQARVSGLCLDRALSLGEPPREPPEPLERPEPPAYATPELLAAVTLKEPPDDPLGARPTPVGHGLGRIRRGPPCGPHRMEHGAAQP
jgi:hypothetical protein